MMMRLAGARAVRRLSSVPPSGRGRGRAREGAGISAGRGRGTDRVGAEAAAADGPARTLPDSPAAEPSSAAEQSPGLGAEGAAWAARRGPADDDTETDDAWPTTPADGPAQPRPRPPPRRPLMRRATAAVDGYDDEDEEGAAGPTAGPAMETPPQNPPVADARPLELASGRGRGRPPAREPPAPAASTPAPPPARGGSSGGGTGGGPRRPKQQTGLVARNVSALVDQLSREAALARRSPEERSRQPPDAAEKAEAWKALPPAVPLGQALQELVDEHEATHAHRPRAQMPRVVRLLDALAADAAAAAGVPSPATPQRGTTTTLTLTMSAAETLLHAPLDLELLGGVDEESLGAAHAALMLPDPLPEPARARASLVDALASPCLFGGREAAAASSRLADALLVQDLSATAVLGTLSVDQLMRDHTLALALLDYVSMPPPPRAPSHTGPSDAARSGGAPPLLPALATLAPAALEATVSAAVDAAEAAMVQGRAREAARGPLGTRAAGVVREAAGAGAEPRAAARRAAHDSLSECAAVADAAQGDLWRRLGSGSASARATQLQHARTELAGTAARLRSQYTRLLELARERAEALDAAGSLGAAGRAAPSRAHAAGSAEGAAAAGPEDPVLREAAEALEAAVRGEGGADAPIELQPLEGSAAATRRRDTRLLIEAAAGVRTAALQARVRASPASLAVAMGVAAAEGRAAREEAHAAEPPSAPQPPQPQQQHARQLDVYDDTLPHWSADAVAATAAAAPPKALQGWPYPAARFERHVRVGTELRVRAAAEGAAPEERELYAALAEHVERRAKRARPWARGWTAVEVAGWLQASGLPTAVAESALAARLSGEALFPPRAGGGGADGGGALTLGELAAADGEGLGARLGIGSKRQEQRLARALAELRREQSALETHLPRCLQQGEPLRVTVLQQPRVRVRARLPQGGARADAADGGEGASGAAEPAARTAWLTLELADSEWRKLRAHAAAVREAEARGAAERAAGAAGSALVRREAEAAAKAVGLAPEHLPRLLPAVNALLLSGVHSAASVRQLAQMVAGELKRESEVVERYAGKGKVWRNFLHRYQLDEDEEQGGAASW